MTYAESSGLMNLTPLRWRQHTAMESGSVAVSLGREPVSAPTAVAAGVGSMEVGYVDNSIFVGDFVNVIVTKSNVVQCDLSGWFQVTIVGETTFYVNNPNANNQALVESGVDEYDISLQFQTLCQKAIIRARSTNTGNAYIGPTISGDFEFLAPGAKVEVAAPPGGKFDLADWYLKAGTNRVLDILSI